MTTARAGARGALLTVLGVVAVAMLWMLRGIVMLVAFSVLIAYALDPVVRAVERIRWTRTYRLPRPAAAAAVMFALVMVVAWSLSWAVPKLVVEIADFVKGAPDNAERLMREARVWARQRDMESSVDPLIDSVRGDVGTWLENLGSVVLKWVGNLLSTLGKILGLAVLPLLSYYLLAERQAVKLSLLGFVPEGAHERVHEAIGAIDRALASYVRGQAVVSLVMGISVALVLGMLGFPVVLLLGLIVAVAEVLPYIGFVFAAIAIALTGYGIDFWHAALGVLAYAAINIIIGLVVTPRVMGRHLKLHPFVVTVSVLAGAELLGPPGAMLALPAAAVLQALAQQFATRTLVQQPVVITGSKE